MYKTAQQRSFVATLPTTLTPCGLDSANGAALIFRPRYNHGVLDRSKLEALRTAAVADDWATVGELYIDIVLDAEESLVDRCKVEALGPYVRFRNAEALAAVLNEVSKVNGKLISGITTRSD